MSLAVADEAPSPPLRQESLLARLRGDSGRRPMVDPGLAGGLRDWLEDGLAVAVAALPAGAPPVRLSKEAINGALRCAAPSAAGCRGPATVTVGLARGSLVDALFRQWLTTGAVGEPMADAIDALEVGGDPDKVVAFLAALDPGQRRRLADEVADQAARIVGSWPVPAPSWLARTQERLTVPLAGGRVVLSGVIDLALGAPSGGRASVCIVDVKSGRRRLEHRGDLHLYSLLETLRSGAPPFRVATYYSATGELEVEPVGPDVLIGTLHRVLAAAAALCSAASGSPPAPTPGPLCASGHHGKARRWD